MEKHIWVIGADRKEMITAQRQINSTGSMRAFCILSFDALKKAIASASDEVHAKTSAPSLILFDYEYSIKEEFESLSYLKKEPSLAGVPLLFMIQKRTPDDDEVCFQKGATVVVEKPFSDSSILRIERMAWQYDVTKNYEKMLVKQAEDLEAAKEIVRLNKELESKNELLRSVFGRYFSENVTEMILNQPRGASIGGEKCELTVMMADLRGFTSVSEELESDAMTDMLNEFFSNMIEVIFQHQGTVIELLGDAILAVFGAPVKCETHCENAVRAAIEMQNAMAKVNDYCIKHGYPTLEMGIGVHTGVAFVGNIGSEKMMRYNVSGRVVNECSRIESHTVGGQVFVSETTLKGIKSPMDEHNRIEMKAKGVKRALVAADVWGIGAIKKTGVELADAMIDVVSKHILVRLYPVVDKMISAEFITMSLCKVSNREIILKSPDMFDEIMELWNDYEIRIIRDDGTCAVSGIYGKCIENSSGYDRIHFTHTNSKLEEWLKKVK